MRTRASRITTLMLAAGCTAGAASVLAEEGGNYPLRPISIIVPFTPGGSNDLVGRVLSQKFHEA